MDESIASKMSLSNDGTFSYRVAAGASVLCLNPRGDRLIVAGKQSFQLLAIEQKDNVEQFSELFDFRNASRQHPTTLQPTDIAWSPHNENCFVTVSTAGVLNIWDAQRLVMVSQSKIHNGTINRVQFHPKNPNQLLTASQDGYAKLIELRDHTMIKVCISFQNSNQDGFRDIHINAANSNIFASALNEQLVVPIWDTRRTDGPIYSLTTADKTQCLVWNLDEPYWLATGGRDRTIRVWNVEDTNNRQIPLFKFQSFGTVAKLNWQPTCRYHIACSTPTVDPRIHVWDIRRTYLPQASFCHYQHSVGDFLWRPNSDNLISVGRSENLVHAPLSSAIKTDQFVSLFSLNVTSKGHVHTTMPNIDDPYVRALYAERHLPSNVTSLKKFYSEEVMSTFLKWNHTISTKSIIGILPNTSADNSVEQFHRFARHWIFGNGDATPAALAKICDINGTVAEKLQRPDLKATWQVIKMIYADHDGLEPYRSRSSRHTPSTNKIHHLSDSVSGHRHHPYHHAPGKNKSGNKEQQQHDFNSNDDVLGRKRGKSQEQIIPANSQIAMIDASNTYIVRDALTDDIIFITPEDALGGNNGYDVLYDNELDIDIMRDGMAMGASEIPAMINGTHDSNETSFDQLSRQYAEIKILDEAEFGPVADYDDPDNDTQASTQSIAPDGSDKFFTIDESYCPTMQNHPLNFDDVIKKTLWYYIENNELQVAVHLLLALYSKLGDKKLLELFNGAHFHWLNMYIELLQKMRLFVKAKQVTKHCIEKEKIPLHYDAEAFDGAMILSAQPSPPKRLPNPTPLASTSSNGKHPPPTLKDFMCSICRIPCRGIFSFCGVCFHGGHIDHIRSWFKTHDECPFGCGHRCKDRESVSRRSRGVSQRHISR